MVLPWLPVWFGAFIAWLVFVRRYELPGQHHLRQWLISAVAVFVLGSMFTVDLWAVFLVFWTIQVVTRAISLRRAFIRGLTPQGAGEAAVPPAPGSDGDATAPVTLDQLHVGARFHTRILQFLGGSLVLKTAMILLNIRIVELDL